MNNFDLKFIDSVVIKPQNKNISAYKNLLSFKCSTTVFVTTHLWTYIQGTWKNRVMHQVAVQHNDLSCFQYNAS